MPVHPRTTNRAAPPTAAKRQPVKPVQNARRRTPPPPDARINGKSHVQLARWHSTDNRLRLEDRGYELVMFSDGRPVGNLTHDDAESLLGALLLSAVGARARRGTLSGGVKAGGFHFILSAAEGDPPVPPTEETRNGPQTPSPT